MFPASPSTTSVTKGRDCPSSVVLTSLSIVLPLKTTSYFLHETLSPLESSWGGARPFTLSTSSPPEVCSVPEEEYGDSGPLGVRKGPRCVCSGGRKR